MAQRARELAEAQQFDEDEDFIYTYDMFDEWYEVHAAREATLVVGEGAAAAADPAEARGAVAGEELAVAVEGVPPPIMRPRTSDEERAIRAEQERWRRLAALVAFPAGHAHERPRPAPPSIRKTKSAPAARAD